MPITRHALVRAAAIAGVWTVVGLFLAAQMQLQLNARAIERPLWYVLAPSLVGAWIWALYTPFLVLLARRLRHLRERSARWRGWILFLGAHGGVATVVAVADAAAWARVRPLLDGVALPFDQAFAGTLLMNVASYIAIVALTEAVDYAARWRERDDAASALARTADALRQRLNEARLRTLEAQLRPHFLYNTLNLVAELVHEDPDAADAMLTHLGALLRRSCQESQQLVPLHEEIRFVRAYAEILAQRYRDRVLLGITVPGELEMHPVPAFLLQPLVENAFRHGVERRESASAVDVTAAKDGGSLVIRVRDRALARERDSSLDGNAVVAEAADHAGNGIGLGNTRERLELLHGEAAGLTLVSSPTETVVSVWLPFVAASVERGDRVTDAGALPGRMAEVAGVR